MNAPTFFILGTNNSILERLLLRGFQPAEQLHTENIMVLGDKLLNVSSDKHLSEKYQLLRKFNSDSAMVQIFEYADQQLLWLKDSNKKELELGSKKLKISVSKQGILIDRCIVPIHVIMQQYNQLKSFNALQVVTHMPAIKPDVHFLTIGCAEYSMRDIATILDTYKAL
jgi:hypothetical protein